MKDSRSAHNISSPRAIFLLNCAAMVQHGVVLLIVGPIVPNLMATFGVGEATTGMLLGVGSLGFLWGPLIAGAIIDRASVRRALLIGFLIEIVFLLLFGLSGAFAVAVLANLFLHLGASFVEISGSYLPTIIPGLGRAHSRMNLIHAFFSVGAFIGPFLIGLYVEASGRWRPLFFFAIVPTALLALWTIRLRVPRPGGGASAFNNPEGAGGMKENLIAVLHSRGAVWGALCLLCYVGAEVGISSWIVYYLQKVLEFDTVKSAAGLSVLWVFIMAGRYFNSILGRHMSAKALVTISGFGGFAGVIVFLLVDGAALAYILLAWIGLCLSGVFPNVMGELNNRDPGRAGLVTAVMTMGAALGGGIFQWLVGLVADFAGIRAAFVIPAVLQILMVVSFLYALKPERQSPVRR
ncbi:MAG: MFS transporter [Spirochaetales bacterium]|nr:MFS transporter [Spirochaetales bacterium]